MNMGGRRVLVCICYLIIVIVVNISEITAYREILQTESLASFLEEDSISAENINASSKGTNLADTVRVDPLDKLKKYRGGFDVRNEHYWSSTAFTGIYGYAIGVFWLLCGVLFGIYLLATKFCCTKRKNKKLRKRVACSRQCYLWPIIMGASLTFLAIIVSGVVIGGTTKFNSRVKTVLDIIIDTTEGAATTIYNVTGAMRDVRDNVATSSTDEVFTFLGSTSQRLDTQAAELSRQARKNRRLINTVLKVIYVTSTIIISLNLVLVTALAVSGIIRLRKIFYTLIILCWIMAALCWVYFGLYFFLDKFTGDTCTVLKDFQQDPFNNSLSDILPCDELASAESVLLDTRVGISDLIDEVNRNISAQFGQNLIRICNPFSAAPEYNYEPGSCSSSTIRIGDIPQFIKAFTCSVGENSTCGDGQFISKSDFDTVEVYTRSIQNLLDALPGMESLVDCQIVKDAFATIISKHCKPVNKYVTMVWASMIVLSTIMVILVLLWTLKAFHERRDQFSDGSVKPHSATADAMEVDENIGSVDKSNHTLDP